MRVKNTFKDVEFSLYRNFQEFTYIKYAAG
jgi:hypothetical protein